MRLLVIERDSTRSAALRDRLGSCGAQVVDDATGVDAGRLLARTTVYDAVLIGHPADVGALEACTLLVTEEALRGCPLLVIQRQPKASARGRALASGASNLLAEELGVLAWGELLTRSITATRRRRRMVLGLVDDTDESAATRALAGAGFGVDRVDAWPSRAPDHWAAVVAASPPPEPIGVPVVPLWRGTWFAEPRRRPLAELIEAIDLVAGAAPGDAPAVPAGSPREDAERRARFVEQARAEVLDLADLLRQLTASVEETGLEDLALRCELLGSRAREEGLEEVAGQATEIAAFARAGGECDSLLGAADGLAALEAALRPPHPQAPSRRELMLLLVDDNPTLSARFRAAAEARGFTAVTAQDQREAAAITSRAATAPDVVFVAGHLVADPEAAEELRRIPALSATPLILLASPTEVHERLAAIHLEAELVLDLPVSAEDLLRSARRLVDGLAGPRRPLVAVVGPDSLDQPLREHGFDVVLIAVDAASPDRLARTSADALLLDSEAIDAPVMLRRLRLDPRLRPVPVLVRCATDAREEALAALEAGADDALPADVGDDELIARLRSRVERFASLSASASVDPLTGVAVWRRFEERLDDEVAIAQRTHRPFSVASIEIDPAGLELPPRTREALVVAVARHLRQRVRRSDLVGRARGDEFLVLLRECTCDDAKRVIEGVLADFRRQGVHGVATAPSLSAGIGSYPDHGDDAPAVLEAARRARLRGRQHGGSAWVRVSDLDRQVLPERTGAQRVLLVDPDENVRRMVAYALEQRGFVVDHLPDGALAAERLLEQHGALPPDLVVLEADLPFVSGFDLLRRLRESPRTRRPKVVMLTSRKAESDVIRAFELGVDDHVGKPFSVPVLVARLRALLGAKDLA